MGEAMAVFNKLNKAGILYRLLDHSSRIRRAFTDEQRKPVPRFVYEYFLFTIRKRMDVSRYISSQLFRKHVNNPYAYLSIREYQRLLELVTRPELINLFDDKLEFHRYFKNSGISIPKYLGRFSDGYWHDDAEEITKISDASTLYQHVNKLTNKNASAIFAKPRNDHGGFGAVKITEHSDFDELYEQFSSREYIFQEVISQHPAMKAVFPHCLNSARFITCMGKDGVAHIACARVRFGLGKSIVDNSSSGGFFTGVDLKTGRLSTLGIKSQAHGGELYTHHPDTDHEIKGMKLPMFREALEMVLAAANHLPYPLVGWDIGFSTGGPVLIEGNRRPDYFNDEVATGPYRENPVLGSFIDELTLGRGL